jgi:hypothetical protein
MPWRAANSAISVSLLTVHDAEVPYGAFVVRIVVIADVPPRTEADADFAAYVHRIEQALLGAPTFVTGRVPSRWEARARDAVPLWSDVVLMSNPTKVGTREAASAALALVSYWTLAHHTHTLTHPGTDDDDKYKLADLKADMDAVVTSTDDTRRRGFARALYNATVDRTAGSDILGKAQLALAHMRCDPADPLFVALVQYVISQ